MVLAVQETGTSTSTPASTKKMPAMIITLLLDASSSTQLVHLAPTTEMSTASTASRMAMMVMARAACRSCGSASRESYTLHCIWPVLCTTQFIHRPSQMVCAVTMLAPMKAVTLHIGMAHTTMDMMKPMTPRAMPTISSPMDMMAVVVVVGWRQTAAFC
ncbi:hypothetical protein CRUP_028885 [Coryphaenoides rupestris]|nr:hypothetical protein CRUP_028885 [Coryphaenoides rupestris]